MPNFIVNRAIFGTMNRVGPGLQLTQRLTQTLILSPQMQQSLALLQAPTLELKALVEQELQQNPVLEEVAVEELISGTNRSGTRMKSPPRPIRWNRRRM